MILFSPRERNRLAELLLTSKSGRLATELRRPLPVFSGALSSESFQATGPSAR